MADVVPVHGVHVFVPDRIVAHGRPPPSLVPCPARPGGRVGCFRVRVCVPVRGVWPGCRVAFFDRVDEADVPAARVDDDLRELAYRLRRDAGESDEAHLGRGFRLAVFRTVRFSPDAISCGGFTACASSGTDRAWGAGPAAALAFDPHRMRGQWKRRSRFESMVLRFKLSQSAVMRRNALWNCSTTTNLSAPEPYTTSGVSGMRPEASS